MSVRPCPLWLWSQKRKDKDKAEAETLKKMTEEKNAAKEAGKPDPQDKNTTQKPEAPVDKQESNVKVDDSVKD